MNSPRDFLQTGWAVATTLTLAACQKKPVSRDEPNSACLDYSRSFVCNSGQSNASNEVRMWIESRTIVRNHNTETEAIYYQGARSESTRLNSSHVKISYA